MSYANRQAHLLKCAFCTKPMEHQHVVAIPQGRGDFKFAHRGECAKNVRLGRNYLQPKMKIDNGVMVLDES